MMSESIDLTKFYKVMGGSLDLYTVECPLPDCKNWKRPAVIVVAGGAYEHVSKREGATVACNFLARGFQCFVLNYLTVNDGVRYPEQLHELSASVDYLKKNADKFCINGDEIFVLGFSAGGHLTANLAVDYSSVSAICGEPLDCKPTAVGLCYPVISEEFGHLRSHENLLKGYPEEEKKKLLARLNLDKSVTVNTVPSFIWTTASDKTVPAQNSIVFALELAKHNVKYELHIYPDGDHGSSTCDLEVNSYCPAKNAQWIDNCASFFRLFTTVKF